MNTASEIMKSAWTLARQGAAEFGGSARTYLSEALRAAWRATRKPVRKAYKVGRDGHLTANLYFTGRVVGGGAVSPSVRVYSDYDKSDWAHRDSDDRSGSGRSGSISWDLSDNRLYLLQGISVSSREGKTFYLSTYDGVSTFLDRTEFYAEMARRYPTGYELARVKAAQARVEEEARKRRQIEIEKKRLEEMKAEAERRETALAERRAENESAAEHIKEKGQEVIDGLPLLKGTPKQVAWALKIRSAVRAREPKNPALKRGTRASYWIENYKSVLPRF